MILDKFIAAVLDKDSSLDKFHEFHDSFGGKLDLAVNNNRDFLMVEYLYQRDFFNLTKCEPSTQQKINDETTDVITYIDDHVRMISRISIMVEGEYTSIDHMYILGVTE